jgi:hypothetical protein
MNRREMLKGIGLLPVAMILHTSEPEKPKEESKMITVVSGPVVVEGPMMKESEFREYLLQVMTDAKRRGRIQFSAS